MSKLCETHSLALADDGKCVLCRRQTPRFVALESRERTASEHIITAMLGAGVLIACGLVVWAIRIASGPGPGTHASAAQAWVPETAADGGPGVPRPVTLAAMSPAATPTEPTGPLPSGTPPLPARADDEDEALPSAAPKRITDARATRALHAAQASVEATKRKIPIQMFSTSWCTVCESSRYYLIGRELTYRDADIERDRGAAKRLGRINPMRSVPTFVIDGEVLIGFNAWQIEGALEDAARRRLAKQSGPRCRADRRCQTK